MLLWQGTRNKLLKENNKITGFKDGGSTSLVLELHALTLATHSYALLVQYIRLLQCANLRLAWYRISEEMTLGIRLATYIPTNTAGYSKGQETRKNKVALLVLPDMSSHLA